MSQENKVVHASVFTQMLKAAFTLQLIYLNKRAEYAELLLDLFEMLWKKKV